MNCLEKRILSDASVIEPDVLKVDSFLNHQIDVTLLKEMGREFHRMFSDKKVDKVLTVEASGIAIACYVAEEFGVPLLFAKKGEHRNVGKNVYTADVFSFTKNKTYTISVSREYLKRGENILVIDDFLANGKAVFGLKKIIDDAGAVLSGVGIAIEKAFQPGEKELKKAGVDVRALAVVEAMSSDGIKLAERSAR